MNDKLDLATILSLPLDVRQVLIQEKKEALARLEASVAYDELEAHEKNEFICGRDAKPGDVVYLKVVERLMDESIPDSDPSKHCETPCAGMNVVTGTDCRTLQRQRRRLDSQTSAMRSVSARDGERVGVEGPLLREFQKAPGDPSREDLSAAVPWRAPARSA